VPFLTSKHSLEYCFSYAERAEQHGFSAIVVLGGDKAVGTPRVVEHAWQLREMLRARSSTIVLGGWANPHADPDQQVEYLAARNFSAEFYLTQIVSHHHLPAVKRFLASVERHRLAVPGMFGVFFYRSANARTLEALKGFLPVPIAELTREFKAGASAEDICGRTIRELADAGVRHFYISNLPISRASATMEKILSAAGLKP
jgi:5,10-methylenetetrahydrofolate reductase